MEKKHNYGIDLSRLVFMFMICNLHILKQGGVLSSLSKDSINFFVIWFIEIFSFCAVDGFAFISGYVSTNKPCKYEKLLNIWFEVFFYSFIVSIILMLFGIDGNLSKIDIIKTAFPIIFDNYWYMSAYFLLFLLIPLLNKLLFKISLDNAKKLFITLIVIYPLMYFIFKSFKVVFGLSALLLIVLYCLGVLAKRINLFQNIKSIVLLILMFLLIKYTWYCFIYLKMVSLVNYASPTIILSSIIMVILFSRLKIKNNIISKLSSLALGIYLLQANQVIWNEFITDKFIFIADSNIIVGVLSLILCSFAICSLGLIVDFFRSVIFNKLRIDLLSKRIVSFITK